MVKIEDPHLVHIDFRGKRAKISLNEYQLSAEEWNHIRTAAFARLRKTASIPDELLDLVEHFKERTLVQMFIYKTADGAGLRYGIKAIGKKTSKTKQETTRRLAEIIAAHKRTQNDEKKNAMTASEALAFFLRISLRELKHAERTRKAAPVRALKQVPRSLIAEIAMDLLGSCETWNYSPGPSLNALLRELLNVESYKHGTLRHVDAQEKAIFIIAQAPTVHTRELARILEVNASTISRWRRSAGFKERVERTEQWIASLKSSGRWSEMIESAKRPRRSPSVRGGENTCR